MATSRQRVAEEEEEEEDENEPLIATATDRETAAGNQPAGTGQASSSEPPSHDLTPSQLDQMANSVRASCRRARACKLDGWVLLVVGRGLATAG